MEYGNFDGHELAVFGICNNTVIFFLSRCFPNNTGTDNINIL